MLGAHFDSWHGGTGATDNAAGSAVMMEAMRILKTAGLPLRRTVRIGLWGGEEQGLHRLARSTSTSTSATARRWQLKPAHAKFAGYFNVDNGTGAIRGVYLQGNEAVAPIFEAWMKPFNNLGMTTLTIRNTGGTDHQSFDAVGLPGFQFIQDPVEYGTRTHHSNMDVYERVQEEDMTQERGDRRVVRLPRREPRRAAAAQAAARSPRPPVADVERGRARAVKTGAKSSSPQRARSTQNTKRACRNLCDLCVLSGKRLFDTAHSNALHNTRALRLLRARDRLDLAGCRLPQQPHSTRRAAIPFSSSGSSGGTRTRCRSPTRGGTRR